MLIQVFNDFTTLQTASENRSIIAAEQTGQWIDAIMLFLERGKSASRAYHKFNSVLFGFVNQVASIQKLYFFIFFF